MKTIHRRVGILQRVLPDYRAPFFDHLADSCPQGLAVFSGLPRPDESIQPGEGLKTALHFPAHNIHLFRGSYYLCWQNGLLDWLEAWQPEVLIVEANPRYLSTPLAVRWMKKRGRPVIGWGLGLQTVRGGFQGLRRRLREGFINQFDALLVYSSAGKEAYIADGFPPGRIFVAPNAAAPRPTGQPPARHTPHAGEKLTALFVGRLQERKRLDLLIHACANLHPALQPNLVIVGDGPALPALEQLAAETYPAARFTGDLRGPALDAAFDAADLFVLPGSGGLAVQQALAHALPVLMAEGDGTQTELVRAGNGWLAPPDSLEGLTYLLGEALKNPSRLRRMGLESFHIAVEEVNLERMAGVFAEAIQSVFCQK
jgi:glycosyltransferase involved in cell wall biosynthesis